MKNTLTLLLSILTSIGFTHAQSTYLEYQGQGTNGVDITSSSNGYQFQTSDASDGSLRVLDLNAQGEVLAEQHFFPNSANLSYRDGFFYSTDSISTSPNRDIVLSKMDGNGNVVWQKTIQRPLNNYGSRILPTSDGGLLIAGGTEVAGDTLHRVFLVKTDGDGNVKWQRILPKSATHHDQIDGSIFGLNDNRTVYFKEPPIRHLIEMADGGFVLNNTRGARWISHKGYSDNLLRLDPLGNLLWEKSYSSSSKNISNTIPSLNYNPAIHALDTYPDGSLLVHYTTRNGTSAYPYMRLTKINAAGDDLWTYALWPYEHNAIMPFTACARPDGGAWLAVYDATYVSFYFGFHRNETAVYRINNDGELAGVGKTYPINSGVYYDYSSTTGNVLTLDGFKPTALLDDGNGGFVMAGTNDQQVEPVPFFIKEDLAAQCSREIDGFWFYGEYDGHHYFGSHDAFSYQDAVAIAESLGGKILVINSEAENNFIAEHSFGGSVFIGLSDQVEEGQPAWHDGTPLDYTNFDSLDKNSTSADFVQLNLGGGQWVYTENEDAQFILEMDCGQPHSPRPDLKPTTLLNLPEQWTAINELPFDLVLENTGGSDLVGNASGRVFLSENKRLTSDDVLLGDFTLTNLQRSTPDTLALLFDIPSDVPNGSYYVLVEMDGQNLVDEQNELNNVIASNYWLTVGPDLTLKNLIYPGSSDQGESIYVQLDLHNIGSRDMDEPIDIGFYFSKNPNVSTYLSTPNGIYNHIYLGSIQSNDLAAGDSTTLSVTFDLPVNFPLGEYYLYAFADAQLTFSEASEYNNMTGNGLPLVISGNHAPDLTVNNVGNYPTTLAQGERMQFDFSIANIGLGEAYGEYENVVALSKSPTELVSAVSSVTFDLTDTPAGSDLPQSVELGVRANAEPGIYYLLVHTDYDEKITEASNAPVGNNIWASIPIQIVAAATPDLNVSNLTNLDTVATQGDTLYYQFDVNNLGQIVSAGDYMIRKYISTSPYYYSSAIEVGTILTGWTPPGSIPQITGGIAIPPDLPAGDYYLHIKTDADDNFIEENEGNNVLTSASPIHIQSSAEGFSLNIECPDELELTAPSGVDFATVLWDEGLIEISENCSGTLTGVSISQDEGLLNGSCFPIGTSTVQYAVGGFCNELYDTAFCSFDITVSQLPTIFIETQATVCQNEPYNGQFYQADTILMDTISYPFADSVFVTVLTVLPSSFSSFSAQICDGEAFDFNGIICTQPGPYEQIFTAINGCDSVVTLILDVLPTYHQSITTDICQGGVSPLTGIVYENPGSFMEEVDFITNAGCDSIISLTLHVHPEYQDTMDVELCVGDASPLTGNVFTDPGSYLENLLFPSQYGCDSSITANFIVHPEGEMEIDTGLPYGALYNNVILTQDTQFVFYDTTEFGCLLTITENVMVGPNAINNLAEEIAVHVFPNPTNGDFFIELNLPKSMALEIAVFDLLGRHQSVLHPLKPYPSGQQVVPFDMADWESGSYFLKIGDGERWVFRKVVRM